jgi:PAS domain S-box-containing protein/putative nucleotidyltransferase with HDIG domain
MRTLLQNNIFQELLQSIPDTIVVTDENGLIEFVNSHAKSLFGYEENEIVGQYIEFLLPEKFKEIHKEKRNNFSKSPVSRSMGTELNLVARKKGGGEFPVEISLSPIQTSNGEKIISAVRDISKRVNASIQIEEKNLELTKLNEQLHNHHKDEQLSLLQLSEKLLATLDIKIISDIVVEMVKESLSASASALFIPDIECEFLLPISTIGWGNSEQAKNISILIGNETAAGYAFEKRIPVQVEDMQQETRFRVPNMLLDLGLHSALSVPMLAGERTIGALQINRNTPGAYTDHEIRLLGLIANQGAIAIEKAQLFINLRDSYDHTLRALVAALDARDKETEGHSQRVVAYTLAMAEKMSISDENLEIIKTGALLHDIGKIAIPDAILHKPGPLNDEEWEIMRKHPKRGEQMIGGIQFLENPAKIVISHHERCDGKGYPNGLSGEDIPLGARIFAVADTLDAITSDRPYRKGRSFSVARKEILAWTGSQFDPQVIEAFNKISDNEWIEIKKNVHKKPIS